MADYNEEDDQELAAVLVGRRIVEAEMGCWDVGQYDKTEGKLVLDDGTILYLAGNDGGCGCNAGCYPLTSVAKVDNVITSAGIYADPDYDDYSNNTHEGVYRIFVFADGIQTNIAEFSGTDGNGYYGTGFSVKVVRPK